MVDSLNPRSVALDDCYAKLSEEDRRLIDARYQIGATVEVIAAQLGRSVHSVYRSLRRIHQWLFECIQRDERGPNRAGNAEKERLP
jgi:IS30 family transposase